MPRDDRARTARSVALPATGTLDRGELQRQLAFGRCLAWLAPLPAPMAGAPLPDGVRLVGPPHAPEGLVVDLVRHPDVRLRRTAVPAACVEPADDHLALLVPSTPELLDVSRTPVQLRFCSDELTVRPGTERARVWVGLTSLTGSTSACPVPPYAAVAVGPVVLWYLPLSVEEALPRLRPAPQALVHVAGSGFLAPSEASARLVTEVRRLAARRCPAPPVPGTSPWDHGEPFLLAGETGVGKNLLAQAALPEGAPPAFAIVQPEEVRGWIDLVAFYGARGLAHDGQRVRDRPGRLDVLRHPGGVLLFDEIHSLDDEFRYRLVELLTYWTFRPRGDEGAPTPIRGLPIFATSRPEEVRDGARFPPDLFYRMGGEASLLEVPPLRTRRWEIPRLAAHLLGRGPAPGSARLGPDVTRKLLLHDWPGNVRELDQVMREAASRAGGAGAITPELVEVGAGRGAGPVPWGVAPVVPASEAAGAGTPTFPSEASTTLPPAAEAVAARGGARDVVAAAWLPARLRWVDLVALRARLADLEAVREALVSDRARRGRRGANRAAVNRELGRLVRCDHGLRPGCAESLCCRLASGAPGEVVAELASSGAAGGLEEPGWPSALAGALLDLVVERLHRQIPGLEAAAPALRAAQAGRDPRRSLEAAVAALGAALRGA